MARYKVLMTDELFKIHDIEKGILKQIDAELIIAPSPDEDTLCKMVEDCDAIMATYAEVTRKVIESAVNCKVIVRTGIGYNNVDLAAASENGIMVANVLNYCIHEVADHALALMLSLLRNVVVLNKVVHNGAWDKSKGGAINRLAALTLGLYGFGNIARQVAVRAKAFGMKVTAYDPFLPDSIFEEYGVERADSSDELVSGCDVLSVHLQLNESTTKIINAATFQRMRPTAYLINISRGGLVDEKDLLEAIERGTIAGCGLDVMADEPGDLHSRLMTYDNVVITPHVAFSSLQSDDELMKKSAEQIVQTFTQGYPEYWLNKQITKR